jgi:hypothetical protein
MTTFQVSKKFNIKLTYKPPFREAEELVIGQLWEYQEPKKKPADNEPEPHWFQFAPKYLKEFDFRLIEDGRDNKQELLECIKLRANKLIENGYIPDKSKLLFSMSPVEQTF